MSIELKELAKAIESFMDYSGMVTVHDFELEYPEEFSIIKNFLDANLKENVISFYQTKVFSQEEFTKIKKNDFINMMETEYRSFEIYLVGKYRLDLYEDEKGWVISLFEKMPNYWIDDPEDERYRIIFKEPRYHNNAFEIFDDLRKIFKGILEGKKNLIKNLF